MRCDTNSKACPHRTRERQHYNRTPHHDNAQPHPMPTTTGGQNVLWHVVFKGPPTASYVLQLVLMVQGAAHPAGLRTCTCRRHHSRPTRWTYGSALTDRLTVQQQNVGAGMPQPMHKTHARESL